MKRTYINSCKIVGNKINNILGCSDDGPAVSYDCKTGAPTGDCIAAGTIDSGISGVADDYMTWYVANHPSDLVINWFYAYVGAVPVPDACLDASGDATYRIASISIWDGPNAVTLNTFSNWNDMLAWVATNGCSSINAGMTFLQAEAELLNCYGVGSHFGTQSGPCHCYSGENNSCLDNGKTDSGILTNAIDFQTWYTTNQPSTPVEDWFFAYTGQPVGATACLASNGEPFYFLNGMYISVSGVLISPNFSQTGQSWNDLINWLIADGCTSVTLGMDFAQVSAELIVCYGASAYVAINGSPCSCTSGCYDPGTGNGQYATLGECEAACVPTYDCEDDVCVVNTIGTGAFANLQACIDSGCEFNPVTDTNGKLVLWLRARAADLSMNATPPFIDKWDDTSSGSAIQYNAGVPGGLGTANHPSWDGTVGDEWVVFDGGDFMDSATSINLNTSVDNGWAIAFTVMMDDWGVTNVVVGDDNTNNGMIKFVSNTGVHMKLWNPTLGTSSTKGVTIDTPATLVNTEAYVFIWTMDPITNDATLWIDGVKQINSHDFPMGYDFQSLDEVGAKNGGTLGMTGGIKEYMVFEDTLSLTDIANLNTYMYNKL